MILIDTNIAVSFWIETDWTESVRQLFSRDDNWHTETYCLVEFSNVLTTYARQQLLSENRAKVLLYEAESFLSAGFHTANHHDALSLALRLKVSAYDARFLIIAQSLNLPLITEDKRLRNAAPLLTQSVQDALL